MKIKIHSSLKNIRLMVSIGIPIEEAIALAASTIVEYGSQVYLLIITLGWLTH